MYVLGSFLVAIANILSIAITVYTYIILGSAIVSWVNADPYNPIVRFLRGATEPVFRRVRRFLPMATYRTGFDFAPMIVIILLLFTNYFLLDLMLHYGTQLKLGL